MQKAELRCSTPFNGWEQSKSSVLFHMVVDHLPACVKFAARGEPHPRACMFMRSLCSPVTSHFLENSLRLILAFLSTSFCPLVSWSRAKEKCMYHFKNHESAFLLLFSLKRNEYQQPDCVLRGRLRASASETQIVDLMIQNIAKLGKIIIYIGNINI